MTGDNFEALLERVGDRGRWQWRVFLVASLGGIFCAFHGLGAAFLASAPDHWCAVEDLGPGWAGRSPDLKPLVLPRERRHGRDAFSQCSYYARDYRSLNLLLLANNGSAAPSDPSLNASAGAEAAPVAECERWEFDDDDPRTTVVTQWQLVCGSKGLAATIQATFMIGSLIGSLGSSTMADRFGRRPAFLLSLGLFLVSSTACAFAPNYATFVVLRIIIAVGLCGIYLCPYIVVTEITGSPNMRSFFGLIFCIPFAIGYMILPGVAYLLRHWASLQLAISVPGISLLFIYWAVPESPRWLVNSGRFPEALRILRAGAAINKRSMPSDEDMFAAMRSLKHKEDALKAEMSRDRAACRSCAILELVRYGSVLRLTAIVYFTWFTVAMVYYGLALNAPQMSSDPYLVFFAAGAVEVPAYTLTYFAVQWAGRRRSYAGSFLFGGAACLCILLVPAGASWAKETLAVLGKFSVTAAFSISYLYTAELFPTEVRTIAVGYGSVFARFGSISAPYVVDLLGSHHDTIPMGLFGCLSIASGLLSFLLPETATAALPESIAGLTTAKSLPKHPDLLLATNEIKADPGIGEGEEHSRGVSS